MKEELKRRGWTQRQFAKELGVSESTVGQLLKGSYGKVPSSVLEALDTLGLEITVQRKESAY